MASPWCRSRIGHRLAIRLSLSFRAAISPKYTISSTSPGANRHMPMLKWSVRIFGVALAASLVQPADADEAGGVVTTSTGPSRPAIQFNRWQEDWSVLANPCVPREPFDSLKYMPLSVDGDSYLSLGLNLRERFEENNAPVFGTTSQRA